MEMTWAQIANSSLPLLGVAIGGIATYMTQTNILNKQLSRDTEREKKEENIERLKIYSKILKLDGERPLGDDGIGIRVFNVNLYKREYRPVFFSKFYLLHQEIAESIRFMDGIIFLDELGVDCNDEGGDLLMNKFNEIIERIEYHLKEYRT